MFSLLQWFCLISILLWINVYVTLYARINCPLISCSQHLKKVWKNKPQILYVCQQNLHQITWIWWFLFSWLFRNHQPPPPPQKKLYPRQNTRYTVSGFNRYIVHWYFWNWSNRWTLINYITFKKYIKTDLI